MLAPPGGKPSFSFADMGGPVPVLIPAKKVETTGEPAAPADHPHFHASAAMAAAPADGGDGADRPCNNYAR